MSRYLNRAGLERGAAPDLWRRTLSRIPSVFGRMVYLASLRDQNTGAYSHYGLAQMFGDRDAERALRRSHEEAFAEWLGFSLEQQRADLGLYLADLNGERRAIIENWLRLTPYRNLIPASAHQPERLLYMTDFETLLVTLKAEYGAAEPDSDA